MFKKALQVAFTFGLLLAGYVGYSRAFALVAARIRAAQVLPVTPFAPRPSKTFKEAIELAARAFGAGHWSADTGLEMYRIYNAERGYWMYAKSYQSLKDGKLLVFEPFALVWVSRDGKDLKTATSDKAFMLLDQPFDLAVKPGASTEIHVINARLEGNVRLQDDKGTPNAEDDLRITGRDGEGMTYVEYDEARQRITHDSFVTIEDGDMRVAGKDIEIVLRPKEAAVPGKAAGFDGAQTIFLRKDVHIIIKDVGRSGVLPGSAAPAPPAPRQGEKTPLDLRCDGLARFDLPEPQPVLPKRVAGPPLPPLPTFAEFDRNVEVMRGKVDEQPGRLLCDHLRLTFYPGDKTAAPARPAGPAQVDVAASDTAKPAGQAQPASADSPLGGLVLRRAVATGHNVELFSPADGIKVRRCNELIHEKFPGRKPGETDDKTYLRTDATRKLEIEKIDIATTGPDKGKASVTQVRCVDATIFQNGGASDQATIVARGPGILETRPALDKPVQRTAVWRDELRYMPVHSPEGELRKQITLTGSPKFHAVDEQTTLDARRMLVIYLRPKPADANRPKRPAGESATDGFELDKLTGLDDVHLNVAVPVRHLTADARLDTIFEPAPATAQPAPAAGASAAAAGDPSAPAPVAAKDANAAEPPPAEPPVFVHATRVWAHVLMRPADEPGATNGAAAPAAGPGKSKGELRRVYLVGAVTFHQDPAPGEAKGTDVSGEACWGETAGDGLWQFYVYDQEPTEDKVFPNGQAQRSEVASLSPARVANKDMTVEGPTIGLDQTTDKAWVIGPGKLVMMTERDLLSDKDAPAPADDPGGKKVVPTVATVRTREQPPAQPDDKAKRPTRKVPVTITWTTEMDFYGQSQDPTGRPTARAEFFSDPKGPPAPQYRPSTATKAETENGMLVCQDMKVYFDRPIKLANLRGAPGLGSAPKTQSAEPEAKHDINLIECFEKVVAIARKVDESKRVVIQQERVEGDKLFYDKVTGNFYVPGNGVVKYWNVEGDGTETQSAKPGSSPSQPAPAVTRTSSTRREKPVASAPGARPGAEPRKAAGTGTPRRQLELTEIHFEHDMKGNFLPGKEGEHQARKADFFGNVDMLHAPVVDTSVKFNFDKPPPGFTAMTSQTMRLVSEPPAVSAPPNSPSRTYMQAYDNAFVTREDATIQADKITYDSEKDLFWAYAYDGRLVKITQFRGIGQPPSVTTSRAAHMIHRTGEAQVYHPQNFQIVDLKTGTRPTPDKPEVDKRPNRPKRGRMPKRGTVERGTFTGK